MMFDYEIFDRISEKVYITDIETNEILFVNKALKKLLNLKEEEDLTGKKCYQVFQGKSEPCRYCTNKKLKEHAFYEWSIYNHMLGMEFHNQDTLIEIDGRKCRLEISTDAVKKEDNLDLFYEKLGNEVLGIALKEEDIDRGIRKSIGLLGEKMHADRIYIFEKDGDVSHNTYEWCAKGVTAEIYNLQNISNKLLSSWYQLFESQGEVVIRNLEDYREIEPGIYATLKPQGIHSLIAQPIYMNREIIGFFGVDNVNPEKMKKISSFMNMIGTYTAELIEKRNYRRKLEKMSYYDGLTELFNRKTAEEMINASIAKCNGTLLILDLDYFKMVNDLMGHQRGDQLLKEVSQKLKDACRTTDIVFRLGGDEFGIYFTSLINEKLIGRKCRELLKDLKTVIKDHQYIVEVTASIGVARAPVNGDSFLRLYQSADEQLYRAKEKGKNRFFICPEPVE